MHCRSSRYGSHQHLLLGASRLLLGRSRRAECPSGRPEHPGMGTCSSFILRLRLLTAGCAPDQHLRGHFAPVVAAGHRCTCCRQLHPQQGNGNSAGRLVPAVAQMICSGHSGQSNRARLHESFTVCNGLWG